MALATIGSQATIASTSPFDASVEGARCSTFFDHSRREALEAKPLSFSTRRATLADLSDPTDVWLYRYTYPSNCIRVEKILPSASSTEEETEPFTVEVDASGDRTILTNVYQAEAVYIFDQSDTTRMSPLFITGWVHLLASYLAGAIVKGKAGVGLATELRKAAYAYLAAAESSDARQDRPDRSARLPASLKARQ